MESQLPDPSHSLMELTTTPQSQGVVSRNHDLVDLHRELPTAFPLDDYERMREQTGRVGQEMKIGEEESEVQELQPRSSNITNPHDLPSTSTSTFIFDSNSNVNQNPSSDFNTHTSFPAYPSRIEQGDHHADDLLHQHDSQNLDLPEYFEAAPPGYRFSNECVHEHDDLKKEHEKKGDYDVQASSHGLTLPHMKSSDQNREGEREEAREQLRRDEKRTLALNDLTTAIDRAYTSTPQMENQRSGFRPKSEEMIGSGSRRGSVGKLIKSKGKDAQREKDREIEKEKESDKEKQKEEKEIEEAKEIELSRILDRIERSSGTRLGEQTYVVDNAKREKKDLIKRESFYADLVEQNTSGRLGNQDCPQRPLSPGDMLRLTEFIRDEPRAGVDMHGFEGQEKELLVDSGIH